MLSAKEAEMGKQAKLKADRRAVRDAEKLKGWKIDIRPYEVRVMDVDEKGQVRMKGGKPVWTTDEFDVQGSLADIIFNRDLNLKPAEAFEAYDLSKKIKSAKMHVVLDSKEMAMVRRAYDSLKGIGENMVPFLMRIRDAEEIQLAEVKGETDNKA